MTSDLFKPQNWAQSFFLTLVLTSISLDSSKQPLLWSTRLRQSRVILSVYPVSLCPYIPCHVFRISCVNLSVYPVSIGPYMPCGFVHIFFVLVWTVHPSSFCLKVPRRFIRISQIVLSPKSSLFCPYFSCHFVFKSESFCQYIPCRFDGVYNHALSISPLSFCPNASYCAVHISCVVLSTYLMSLPFVAIAPRPQKTRRGMHDRSSRVVLSVNPLLCCL